MEHNTLNITIGDSTTSCVQIQKNETTFNGHTCPKCKGKLRDSYPNTILTSDPPQKNVHCSECDYIGFRFV